MPAIARSHANEGFTRLMRVKKKTCTNLFVKLFARVIYLFQMAIFRSK